MNHIKFNQIPDGSIFQVDIESEYPFPDGGKTIMQGGARFGSRNKYMQSFQRMENPRKRIFVRQL